MPKDEVGIREKIHIVLRGADGKVKDERKTRKQKITKEVRDVSGKRPRIS